MPSFNDALRGYAYIIHKRDGFKCVYCGLDGTESFVNWLSLTQDHLLPKGHPERENKEYIVTACHFCNTADNHYFERQSAEASLFVKPNRTLLIEARKVGVVQSRNDYLKFYKERVVSEMPR